MPVDGELKSGMFQSEVFVSVRDSNRATIVARRAWALQAAEKLQLRHCFEKGTDLSVP